MTIVNWELELERALLKCALEKRVGKGVIVLRPVFLPEKPEDNWTYKGRSLKPIHFRNQVRQMSHILSDYKVEEYPNYSSDKKK